jgi:hypothetical protein
MSTASPAPAPSPQPSPEGKSPGVKEEEKPAIPNRRLPSTVPANPITATTMSASFSLAAAAAPPPIQVAPVAPTSPAPSPSTPGSAAGDDIRAARAKYFSSPPAKKENDQEGEAEDGQQGSG